MKRKIKQNSTIGIIGTAVATATLLGCSASSTVQAASIPDVVTSGVYVSILSPTVNQTDPNKQIEISAFYQSAPITGGVSTLELYIDGQQEAVKKLDAPENRGIVSFVISPGTLGAGSHHIVVRVSAADAEIASAATDLSITQPSANATPAPALGGDSADGSAPAVAIMTPLPDATVVGTIDIKVDAHDDSGKAPYVSLFIDHNFKTLRNFPPYDFAWDTTRVTNGYHTLEVWGYNDDQTVGHAEPVTVYVNNPSGRTMVRHDLLDTPPASQVIKTDLMAKALASQTHAAPKAPARLASGETAAVASSARLAEAKADLDASDISDQTLLMSPFLPKRSPQATSVGDAADPKVPAVLAAGPSASIAQSAVLSEAKVDFGASSASDQTLLMAPFLSKQTPQMAAPPVAEQVLPKATSIATTELQSHALTVHTLTYETVNEQASAKVQPLLSPSTVGAQPEAQLVSLTTPVAADDDNGPSLESPIVTARQLSQRAALAADSAALSLRGTTQKMASSSAGDATLFSGVSALQTPDVTAARAEGVVAEHKVAALAVPLGSSAQGFSPNSVLGSGRGSQIVMNDRVVDLDQPLQDRSSFLFAPFRQIFENEGGIVSWNSQTHQVHALNQNRDIKLTIGSKSATVNQEDVTLNATPYLVNNRTMIPLAFVPIALDATVSYDPNTGHVVINSKE